MPGRKYTPKGASASSKILYTAYISNDAVKQIPKEIFGDSFKERTRMVPSVVYKRLMDEAPLMAPGVDEKTMISLLKKGFPGYQEPTAEEIEERKKLSEELQKRFYDVKLKKDIVYYATYPENPKMAYQREFNIINDGDLSMEGLQRNQEFYRKYVNGTKEEQKEANIELLKRLGKIDLSKIDLLDPKSLADNMDAISDIMFIGAEMQPVVARAKELGIDFNDPELADFCEKAEAIYEYGMAARLTIDMYSTPMYQYIGKLDNPLLKDFGGIQNDIPDGSMTYETLFGDIGSDLYEKDRSLPSYFDQLGVLRLLNAPYGDHTISPEERLKKYLSKGHDMFGLRNVEGPAPDLDDETAPFFEPKDAEIKKVYNKFIGCNPASLYSASDQKFNPALMSDMERLCILKDGKLVPAFELKDMPYPFGNSGNISDKSLAGILNSGNYYFINPEDNKPYQIKDGILAAKPSELEIPGSITLSDEDERLHKIEVELYDTAKVKNARKKLYGKNFNEFGAEQYKDYYENIAFNASKVNAELAYPDSSDQNNALSDEDYEAITMFCYADPNVNGKHYYNGKGDPEAIAFAALGMGPNDLYCMRANKDKDENLNIFVDSRLAAKNLIEQHNKENDEPIAEAIARSISIVGTSGVSVVSLTATGHNGLHSASSAYRFLKDHPDIYELARKKAEAMGKDALDKFDKGYKDCHRADNMLRIAEDGLKAEYRLALYKARKMKNAAGKVYTITAEEKKELERKVLLKKGLEASMKNQEKLHDNNVAAITKFAEAQSKMNDIPQDEKATYVKVITDEFNYNRLATAEYDPMIEALDQDVTEYVKIYADTPEDAAVLTEYFNLREKIEAGDPSVQKTPEFIAKMAKTKYAAEKALGIEASPGTVDARQKSEADTEIRYFMGLSDEAFVKQCGNFMDVRDVDLFQQAMKHQVGNSLATSTDLAGYGHQGEAYIKGLFAPKTDSSGMRMDFEKFTKDFEQYQKDIDAIVLDVPEGLSDDDVAMATMGLFLDREDLIKNYEESRKKTGSSLYATKDTAAQAEGAIESFLYNVLAKNDERPNMHMSRNMVPGARKRCAEVIKQYSEGNKEPFAKAVYNAFKVNLDRIMTTAMVSGGLSRACTENLKRCLDVLGREEFKGIVDLSPRELALSRHFIEQQKNNLEKDRLEQEINNYIAENIGDESKHMLDDPEFAAKYTRYQACCYIESLSSKHIISMLKSADCLLSNVKSHEAIAHRELSDIEKMAVEDRETLIKVVEETIIKKSPKYEALKNKTFTEYASVLPPSMSDETIPASQSCHIEQSIEFSIQAFGSLYENPSLKDPKYDVLKERLRDFENIYNRIKSHPEYMTEDLEEMIPIAKDIHQYASSLAVDPPDIDDPMLLLSSSIGVVSAESIEGTIKLRALDKEIALNVNKALGRENIINEQEKPQEAPAEQTPEEKWYDSFVEELGKLGISFDNPISLGLVREVNDRFNNDRDVTKLLDGDNSNDPEKVMEAMENMHKAYPMAFGNSKIRDRIYQGDNYGRFLKNNMRNPKNISLAEKKRLYMLAKDNKLFVQSAGYGAEASSDFSLIRIKDDGAAVITQPLVKLNPQNVLKQIETLQQTNDPQAEQLIVQLREEWKEKTTFYPEEMDDAIRAASDCGMVEQGKHVVCGNFIDMGIERKYGNLDKLTDEQRKALATEKGAFLSKTKWALNGHILTNLSVNHPEMVKEDNVLELQSKFLNAAAKPEDMRSPAEQKIFEDNYLLRAENALIEKKLCKLFKVDSIDKVPFDKIKDDQGKTFGSEYNYETINKLGKHNAEGKTFEISGVKVIYSANNEKFIKEAPLELYAKEVEALVAELAATDSIFSKDTDSYVNFKNGLGELSQKIRSGLGSGVPDDRTFDTLHGILGRVYDLGTKYQEAHANIEKLSDRQKDRLAVIAKLQNLCDKSQPNKADIHPDDKLTKLAEKIAIETSIDLQSSKSKVNKLYGRSIEMSHHNMKIFANDIRESDAFKALVHGQTENALDALLGQKPGVALKALKRQEEILRKQAEAAEKTAAKQEVKEVKEVKADKGPVAK